MIMAEILRGGRRLALEALLFVLLRRIHRAQLHEFDYGAGKLEQCANRALAAHFADYDELITVRSRLSGNTPIVKIVLGFAPFRQIGAIQTGVDAITATIIALLPGAEVAVIPVAARRPPME